MREYSWPDFNLDGHCPDGYCVKMNERLIGEIPPHLKLDHYQTEKSVLGQQSAVGYTEDRLTEAFMIYAGKVGEHVVLPDTEQSSFHVGVMGFALARFLCLLDPAAVKRAIELWQKQ
jgi:hypothetical protein